MSDDSTFNELYNFPSTENQLIWMNETPCLGSVNSLDLAKLRESFKWKFVSKIFVSIEK